MYVCIYVCMNMYMCTCRAYVCMYAGRIYIHVSVYVSRMYGCMYACMIACMHVYMHECMFV